MHADQDAVLIDVYQGERKFAKDNIYLGDVLLDGLKKNTTDEPDVEVTFRINIDGNLNVSAIDLLTKSEVGVQIKNSLKIPKEKVEKIKQYSEKMIGYDQSKIQKLKKIIELSYLKKIFDEIHKPVLSTSDDITIEEMNLILTNKDAYKEEIDEICRMMRIIIKEQDAFKFDDDDI